MALRRAGWGVAALATAGCTRLGTLAAEPPQTPEGFLAGQPWMEFHLGTARVIVLQPTSTVLVGGLAVLAILAGGRFLRARGPHRSRLFWGVALVLWGLGALSAGFSYQGLGYHLKCAGRQICAWTSWPEVWSLVLSAAAVDAILLAQAHACAQGRGRRLLSGVAVAHAVLYALLVLAGALAPLAPLLTFELLVVFCAPVVLGCGVLNLTRYRRRPTGKDRTLLQAWVGLALTLAAYFAWLKAGVAADLWARGTWLSENDVLHAGLIAWMGWLGWAALPQIEDDPAAP